MTELPTFDAPCWLPLTIAMGERRECELRGADPALRICVRPLGDGSWKILTPFCAALHIDEGCHPNTHVAVLQQVRQVLSHMPREEVLGLRAYARARAEEEADGDTHKAGKKPGSTLCGMTPFRTYEAEVRGKPRETVYDDRHDEVNPTCPKCKAAAEGMK